MGTGGHARPRRVHDLQLPRHHRRRPDHLPDGRRAAQAEPLAPALLHQPGGPRENPRKSPHHARSRSRPENRKLHHQHWRQLGRLRLPGVHETDPTGRRRYAQPQVSAQHDRSIVFLHAPFHDAQSNRGQTGRRIPRPENRHPRLYFHRGTAESRHPPGDRAGIRGVPDQQHHAADSGADRGTGAGLAPPVPPMDERLRQFPGVFRLLLHRRLQSVRQYGGGRLPGAGGQQAPSGSFRRHGFRLR